jgi:hypothetical protein
MKKFCALEFHRRNSSSVIEQLVFWSTLQLCRPSPISCFKGTKSERHVLTGTSWIFILPGCWAHLGYHLSISDISVKLGSDLLHFELRWGKVSLDHAAACPFALPTHSFWSSKAEATPTSVSQLVDRLSQLHLESGDVCVVPCPGHFSLHLSLWFLEITEAHCHPSRWIKVKEGV